MASVGTFGSICEATSFVGGVWSESGTVGAGGGERICVCS